MLTLDKVKIVTKIEYITDLNENEFTQRTENERVKSHYFAMTTPFQLYIEVDYEESELVIEFTGKVLGTDYHKLISKDTIKECFTAINDMGICTLNIDEILNDAEVVKCDITTDIVCENTAGLTAYINGNIVSHRKYNCRILGNGNLIIEKNVTTNDYKKRITIYDKQKEMNKMDNRRFAERYDCDMNDFTGRVRLEMNLNSKAQIRKALGIADTNLMSVLNASAEPIYDFMNEVLADDYGRTPSSRKEYEAELVLRDCNYDLTAVEAKLKALAGKNFHPKRDLEIHRKILAQRVPNGEYEKRRFWV